MSGVLMIFAYLATSHGLLQDINVYFLAAFVAVMTGVLMFWSWLGKRHKKFVDDCVSAALPVAFDRFSENLMTRVTAIVRDHGDNAYHKVKEEFLDPLDRRVTVMETKVDVFWQRIAVDVAKVLHHPEPSRYRVDELLEVLMSGTLTQKEANELRGYLEVIRDWEPGKLAPFVIYQGEQVAAVILLHTMEHVVENREQT